MNRALGISLLVVGVVMLALGFNASQSFLLDLARFFTGTPTEKSIMLLVGGAVTAIIGVTLIIRGGSR